FFIFAAAIYMLFHRGANPAWMEILKINIPEESRKSIFAFGSAAYHAGGALSAIVVGWLLDDYFQAWPWLFPLTALISLRAIIFQIALPINDSTSTHISTKDSAHSPHSAHTPIKDSALNIASESSPFSLKEKLI